MIVCQRCGKENQDHYKFCLGCGAELKAPGAEDQEGVGMMKTMMADVGNGNQPMPSAPPSQGPAGLPGMGPRPGPGPSGPMPMNREPAGPPPGVGPSASMGPPPGAPPPAMPTPAPVGGGYGMPSPSPGPMGPPPGVGGQASAAPGPQRCPSCGADIPPNFKFCGACGCNLGEISGPSAQPQPAINPMQTSPDLSPRAVMTLIRPDGSEGGSHELAQGINKIGRSHGPIFENDGYLSPEHAELDVSKHGATVRDLGSLNGVFVRMTEEEEIQPGQIIRIGQELLRFDLIQPAKPLEDGTEVMGSPNPGYWGKITVIIGNGADGSAFPLLGDSVTLGRERGDINFPDDGYVSGLHARLSARDGKVYLADMGSSNGTFLKTQSDRQIGNDSYILLGQQLFRLSIL